MQSWGSGVKANCGQVPTVCWHTKYMHAQTDIYEKLIQCLEGIPIDQGMNASALTQDT